MPVQMKIQGMDRVVAALGQFQREIYMAVGLAGKDMAKNITDTKGLQNYPPSSERNTPPGKNGNGYYIRGRGWMRKSGADYTLVPSSERLGTRWFTRVQSFHTYVSNTASYAEFIHGDRQPLWAKTVGWRKLAEVANEKMGQSVIIYERHIQALIRRLGL